ncbi:uncharacterized protein LOC116012518 [Ipomoea triloba]|uniref:uncharacterized protein LOC116012518 n=1 Tax=Ipomoea triloba TaxID=35885 RepID=UPI00125CE689|nr:uncharacterized protein LOC116012518 [Ipomoea triloba]
MEMTQESPVQIENAAPKQPALPPVQKENAAPMQPALPSVQKENAAPMQPELPPVQKENAGQKEETLPPVTKPSLCSKTTFPDRLKVPKAFKYPERYTSPTDQMMSPVSKRLFGNGRIRKPATADATAATAPLPPSGNPPKPVKIQPQASRNLISIDT